MEIILYATGDRDGYMLRPRRAVRRLPVHWAETEAENNPKENIT